MLWAKAALVAGLVLIAVPASAQTVEPGSAGANLAEAQAARAETAVTVRIPAGTVIEVELTEAVSSVTSRRGDTFSFRLSEAISTGGVILVPAGAEGGGEVLDAASAGGGGRPGKLVLVGRYLLIGGRRIGLRGMQLTGAGETRSTTTSFWNGYGMSYSTQLHGEQIEIPAGTRSLARLAGDVEIEIQEAAQLVAFAEVPLVERPSPPSVGLPPAGHGRVVFFRRSNHLGARLMFSVREGETGIGRLDNGSYFRHDVMPGMHEFNVGPNSARDTLRLEIEAGEIYYVMERMTQGLLVGRPVLTPSDEATFEMSALRLSQAGDTTATAPEAVPSVPNAGTTPAPDQPAAATDSATGQTEEKARIVFFRPSRLTGGAWAYRVVEVDDDGRVDDDDPRIGRLPNGSYFRHEAEPGIHNYNITGPMQASLAEDRLRVEIEPGETYYVEQTVDSTMGGFRLVPSTQEAFERRRLRELAPREEE